MKEQERSKLNTGISNMLRCFRAPACWKQQKGTSEQQKGTSGTDWIGRMEKDTHSSDATCIMEKAGINRFR